jgi:hypothetical protein
VSWLSSKVTSQTVAPPEGAVPADSTARPPSAASSFTSTTGIISLDC